MLGWPKHNQPMLLTGALVRKPRSLRVADAKDRLKIPLLLPLLILVVLVIAAPMTFNVRQGKLTIQATLGHGGTEFPLGPAGSIELKSHRTPIDLKMELVLNTNQARGRELSKILLSAYEEFGPDARGALIKFLMAKLVLLLTMAVLVGIIQSNGGTHWLRNTLWNVLDSLVLVAILVLALAAMTVTTLDLSPKMKTTGYISELPLSDVLRFAENYGGHYSINDGMLQDYGRGMGVVERQRRLHHRLAPPSGVIRILQVTDTQGNTRGLQIANDILNGELKPFAAVLLTGDLAQLGSSFEASGFTGWPRLANHEKMVVGYVGGNHEDSGAMAEFRRLGFMPLASQINSVDGISIIGADDPLAYNFYLNPNEAELQASSKQLAQQWAGLEPRPQVVVVHNVEQAKDIIAEAKADNSRLVVVFGHDHLLSLKTEGTVTLIGGGTSGAGGYDAKGRDPNLPYTYQILEFSSGSDSHLTGVARVSYYDQNGRYVADYTPID